jgi:hypothetical protein
MYMAHASTTPMIFAIFSPTVYSEYKAKTSRKKRDYRAESDGWAENAETETDAGFRTDVPWLA